MPRFILAEDPAETPILRNVWRESRSRRQDSLAQGGLRLREHLGMVRLQSSWKTALEPEFSKEYFRRLEKV